MLNKEVAEHDIESLLEENKKLKKENKKFKDLYVKKSKEARSMEKQLEIEKDVILGLEEEIERVKGLLNEGTMMKEIERLEKELKGAEEVIGILDAEADEARYEAKEYKEEIEKLKKENDVLSGKATNELFIFKEVGDENKKLKEELSELVGEGEEIKKLKEEVDTLELELDAYKNTETDDIQTIKELKEKADKIEKIIREFGTNGIVDRCLPIWYDEDE